MYAIDLFENPGTPEEDPRPQAAYVPVDPDKPGSRNRALGNANLAILIKAINEPGHVAKLNFLDGREYTLKPKDLAMIESYYEKLSDAEKFNFVYRILVSYNKTIRLLNILSQGTLFEKEEKKSSNYKDVGVQRAMRQAVADFPTASSDSEAFAKSMMVQQDQDKKNINRLKSANQRNQELINKNSELDQSQERSIDDIQREIDKVEKDNSSLTQMVQQMSRANAELQDKLSRMRGKAPSATPATKPQPQLGVSVATDKIPALGIEKPVDVEKPTGSAAISSIAKNLAKPQPTATSAQPSTDTTSDQPSTATTGKLYQFPTKLRQRADAASDEEQPELKFGGMEEDLTHGLEEGPVPCSSKKETHKMRASELKENRSEVWTVHFTDGTAVRVRVTDETDPAMVRKHYANKGKTVAKIDYGYGSEPEAGPGPEAHEPGSGRAVSARTGEHLPEDTKSEFKAVALAKIKKALANPKLDPSVRRDYESRLEKIQALEGNVININRGGHNEFRNKADFLDKRDFVQRQLVDPNQRENYAELKQRLQDINFAGRKLGFIK